MHDQEGGCTEIVQPFSIICIILYNDKNEV